jgi:hypothetical protein
VAENLLRQDPRGGRRERRLREPSDVGAQALGDDAGRERSTASSSSAVPRSRARAA